MFCLHLQHHVDPAIGVYIIDRFTYYALEFLEKVTPDSNHKLSEFVSDANLKFFVCRHVSIRWFQALSVRTPRKEITLASSISVLH